jgi:aryl-alcohol dehydrogenase-like predicted oxidoreductase
MQLRTLGRSGLSVSPLCLGGNVFGWTADETTSHRLLDRYVDAGGNFIDTANTYSAWAPGHVGGESEGIIGRWLKKRGRRNDVVVATKVGMDMPGLGKGLTPAQIERAAEDSLRRLQVDHIDLYYAHDDDAETPLEVSLAAFDRLLRAGKVRAIGASNYTAERLEAASASSATNGLAAYSWLQPLYNLLDREPYEGALAPVCKRQVLGVATYFSLASGFLTGKYRRAEDLQGRPRAARVRRYFDDRGWRVLEALDAQARRLNSTPAGVALAWLTARPTVTSAIASATTLAQLDELVKGVQLQLDPPAIQALDQASAPASA